MYLSVGVNKDLVRGYVPFVIRTELCLQSCQCLFFIIQHKHRAPSRYTPSVGLTLPVLLPRQCNSLLTCSSSASQSPISHIPAVGTSHPSYAPPPHDSTIIFRIAPSPAPPHPQYPIPVGITVCARTSVSQVICLFLPAVNVYLIRLGRCRLDLRQGTGVWVVRNIDIE